MHLQPQIFPIAASKLAALGVGDKGGEYHPRPETRYTVKSERPFEQEQSPYCPSYRLRRFRACVQTLLTPWLYQARVSFAIRSWFRLKG
jgi:hypothetical protein